MNKVEKKIISITRRRPMYTFLNMTISFFSNNNEQDHEDQKRTKASSEYIALIGYQHDQRVSKKMRKSIKTYLKKTFQ